MLAINDNYLRAPWADWLYACDGPWWAHHIGRVRETFRGQCWTRDRDAAAAFGLEWIRSASRPGLSRDDRVIHEGSNSGYQAINLAAHFGARRILLIGYDMGATGNTHWFGDHAPAIAGPTGRSDFDVFLAAFPQLAADLAAAGIDVVNCTTNTALTAFRRGRLEDEL